MVAARELCHLDVGYTFRRYLQAASQLESIRRRILENWALPLHRNTTLDL